MRHVVAALAAFILFIAHVSASQTGSTGAAAGQPAVRACALLTRDLVAPLTQNKSILDLMPPEEEVLGTTGTACQYGSVRLQLYPGRGGKGTAPAKDFQPISGAGWSGFFHNNRDRYAELMVWTAKHSFTLQVSVPTGSTAEGTKPNVLTLADAIIAKLP